MMLISKRWLNRILSIVVVFLLLYSFVIPCMADEGTVVLRVAFYPIKGFFEYDRLDNVTGYGVEVLNEISQYTGIQFEYIKADSWEQTKDMLVSGKADLRLPVTLPPIPSETLDYTSERIINTYIAIMTLKTRDDLYFNDLSNLPTLKIAITHNQYNYPDIHASLDDMGISEENLVFYDKYILCKEALDDKKVDAIITNIMDLDDDMKLISCFCPMPGYISMSKDNPSLKKINCTLASIKIHEPSFLSSLYEKYYAERAAVLFTREEADYIANSKELTVGNISNRRPLSEYNPRTGELTGINEDIVSWISEFTGLTFIQQAIDPAEKPIEALQSGKYDIVAGVMKTPLLDSDNSIITSDAFFTSDISIVKRKNYKYIKEEKQIVAVKTAFLGLQLYVDANLPEYTIVNYNTDEKCLNALLNGSADIMLQNTYVMNYLLQKPKYEELEMLPTSFLIENTCFAINNNYGNEILVSILNKAIRFMPEEIKNSIVLSNTIMKPYEFTFMDICYRYKLSIHIISTLFLISIGLLVVIFIFRQKNLRHIKEKNIQLIEAYNQAQIASKQKSNFLARMSHEIRTPMNSIIGMTTLAIDHIEEPDVIRKYLSMVTSSSKLLLSLINDVLDMSSIESGKLKIAHEEFDFKQLITSLSDEFYQQCKKKGLNFEIKLNGIIDERFIGDQFRLNQILINLLTNAVKFTKNGGIYIDIEQNNTQQKQSFLRFVIKDTGCGMDEDLLKRLWNPYEQDSATTAREHGGSGLGLSIVKNLVTMMNGAIDVESKKNVGTTFTIELSFDKCELEKKQTIGNLNDLHVLIIDDEQDRMDYASTTMNSFAGRRILLAEDNEMNQIVCVGLLKKAGITCDIAANGAIAFEMFSKSECGYYDAILMDIQMPVMNGYEAAKKIRASHNLNAASIPIIAMTANAFTEDIAEALQSGMNNHVAKPIEYNILLAALERAFKKKEG